MGFVLEMPLANHTLIDYKKDQHLCKVLHLAASLSSSAEYPSQRSDKPPLRLRSASHYKILQVFSWSYRGDPALMETRRALVTTKFTVLLTMPIATLSTVRGCNPSGSKSHYLGNSKRCACFQMTTTLISCFSELQLLLLSTYKPQTDHSSL